MRLCHQACLFLQLLISYSPQFSQPVVIYVKLCKYTEHFSWEADEDHRKDTCISNAFLD